jgi:hypothetical protein
MSFLAPLFLLGAAAIAGPILFHLIARTTRDRTLFSSLRFLRPSPPRLTRKSRIEHWLLLALRCLALALLALAFARPFLRQPTPPNAAQGPARRTVLLLDTSASMRRPDLWKDARARAERHIREANPSDQFAILTFDRTTALRLSFQQWEAASPADRTAVAIAALDTLQPSWFATHLGPALVRAAEELSDTDVSQEGVRRRVILVSDLQEGARLDPLQSYEWPKGIEVVPDPVKPATTGNASIQLLADSPDADRGNDPVLRVRIANSADAKQEQFRVTWGANAAANGAPAPAPTEVYVPPGQARILPLAVPTNAPSLAGTASNTASLRVASIALSGDNEPFDNTLFVHPPQPAQLNVLYLGNDPVTEARQPLFFLARALPETRRQTVRISASRPTASPSAESLDNARLIVATDSLPDTLADALRSRIEAGQTVVFAPASAAAGPTLARLLGVPGTSLVDEKPTRYAMLGELDFRHPLLAPFADPRFSDFTRIHYWRYRRFATPLPTNATVITRFDTGTPAWIDFSIGRGRLLFLASGWSTADSQFALSSKFVPWLYSLLDLAGASTTPALHPNVGDPIPLPTGRTAPLTLRRPDGSTTNLPVNLDRFTETDQPGTWWLGEGPTAIPVAVNLDPSESRTAPLSVEQLEKLGVQLDASLSSAAAPTPKPAGIPPALEAESRQKLWRWIIIGALAVLIIESLVAGITARRVSTAAEPA